MMRRSLFLLSPVASGSAQTARTSPERADTSAAGTSGFPSDSHASASSSYRAAAPRGEEGAVVRTKHGKRLLFEPITIGKRIHLPNRFVMQPMYLNMEAELGLWTEQHMAALATFYGERAHFGAKLMIMGGLGTSQLGRWRDEALMLGTIDASKALSKVTQAVHAEGGYILAQAFHCGRAGRKRRFVSATSTPSPVQPMPNIHPYRIPGLLINYVVTEYQRFARLAEDAGFDGVEIPVSDGTLLHNFLSPAVNDREDAFGGSLEHRMEFLIRVLESVKVNLAAPDDFAVSLRLCLHDLKVGGTTMQETLKVAEILGKSGYVDLLNTSVGMHDSPVQTLASYVPQAAFARSCQMVKQMFDHEGIDVPVVASHRVHSAAVAERLMEREVCDMVGLGRPLLADPQFIEKAEADRDDDILPCVACNHCVNRLYKHQRVTCALNPIAGYELERGWLPTKYKKSVAVVGAGAAGVTCALTLWRRGHDVTLFEKNKYIGGQLNYAKVVPGKEEYQAVLEYWTRELRQSSINVCLETEFTREEVARNHQFFHAVVLTTGSLPRPITSHMFPGSSECPLIVPFSKIFDGSVVAGRRVAIIGNGAIAHDVASYLLHDPRVSRSVDYYLDEWGVNLEDGSTMSFDELRDRTPRNNREVTVFNKADKDADLSRGRGWTQKLWIKMHDGAIIKNGMIEGIDQGGISISILPPISKKYYLACDTIVWCNGMMPSLSVGTWIYEWMKDGAKSRGEMIKDFSIYMAGSCRDAYTGDGHGEQDLLQAVHEGYEIGYKV